MIWTPKRMEIPNGSAGVWRGPCFDAAEVLKHVVAGGWPEQLWPEAVAIPFAEVGLATTITIDGVRSRPTLVWVNSVGDLDLVTPLWGPSYGMFQLRHSLRTAQPPLDPAMNAAAAHKKFQVQGFKAWSSWKNNKHRPFLPAAHRAIAAHLEGAPK
jgi:hypothetical protein